MNQGNPVVEAVRIQQVPGFKIVETVHYNVRLAYDFIHASLIEISTARYDLDGWIQLPERIRGRFCLGLANSLIGVEDLPVEVG
jgi:hypothetical protein